MLVKKTRAFYLEALKGPRDALLHHKSILVRLLWLSPIGRGKSSGYRGEKWSKKDEKNGRRAPMRLAFINAAGRPVTTSTAGADGLAVDLADNVAGGLTLQGRPPQSRSCPGIAVVVLVKAWVRSICATAFANRSDLLDIRSIRPYENSIRASYVCAQKIFSLIFSRASEGWAWPLAFAVPYVASAAMLPTGVLRICRTWSIKVSSPL